MVDDRQRQILRALINMAWADGEVVPEESSMIARFADELGVSLIDKIQSLDAGLSGSGQQIEADLESVLPDHASRLEAIEMLVSLSFADGHLDDGEMKYLGTLAVKLGIGADELDQIRQRVSS
ncbi:MAG: DUF533 domain-containing protein [Vulcanimicrobiota bacterium]